MPFIFMDIAVKEAVSLDSSGKMEERYGGLPGGVEKERGLGKMLWEGHV